MLRTSKSELITRVDWRKNFTAYSWNKKHHLFGYPPDKYAEFFWIASLEARFQWLRENNVNGKTSATHLIKEMIQWGGSQNGTLQKFEEGVEQVNLMELIRSTIEKLGDPRQAISMALEFPGMGLTYASKLLRFLDPENYGALDSRIRKALKTRNILDGVIIRDSSKKSMIDGYLVFLEFLSDVGEHLDKVPIDRPSCNLKRGKNSTGWRAADIEMALFEWAGEVVQQKP
ncbi:MAG: hypothetical protein FJ184_09180 [Gammaproteobacteria bacterium]|nr:hypothetical protein [Gammaproteobacteria bacterium]